MKTKLLLAALLTSAALAAGCKPANSPPSPNEKPVDEAVDATDRKVDKAARETSNVAEEINEYTYAQRTEYADRMRTEINTIKRDMDTLAAKLENASEPAKTEGRAKLEALRVKVAALEKQLDAVQGSSESTWNDVKSGFRRSYDEVRESFQQSRQWLSDKIAP